MIVARSQGADPKKLNGTIQNDILKEYIARGTYIYPPRPAMRIITDLFAWAATEVPEWNTISISGYHIREAGSTAVQEVAFTLADAIAYVEAALAAGLDVDTFAPRLSFFFNAHNNFLEEVAKFRAARRLWARIMKDRFHAKDPRSMMLRFHAQTAGSTLTAQQPDVNVVRTTLQALAAVLGGAQSLHTNSRDEALGLPTAEAARLALRTQQVIAHESGVPAVPDPLGGSEYIERLTDEIEREAESYIARIDKMGGTLRAIEEGFIQREIQNAVVRIPKKSRIRRSNRGWCKPLPRTRTHVSSSFQNRPVHRTPPNRPSPPTPRHPRPASPRRVAGRPRKSRPQRRKPNAPHPILLRRKSHSRRNLRPPPQSLRRIPRILAPIGGQLGGTSFRMSKTIVSSKAVEAQEKRKREFVKLLKRNLDTNDPKQRDRLVKKFRTLIIGP